MTRWPRILIVVALLAVTAAAFAYTEHLKLERSPVTGTRVDKVFSPVCECVRNVAVISFVLRRPETVTLEVLDSGGRSVRTIVDGRREPKGRVSYTWDGRDDADRVVADARYRPRVSLERHGRTIVLPNPIRVDTTPPLIRMTSVRPRVFSPDGDGRRDRVTIRFRVDERSRAMLFVDGRRQALTKFRKSKGQLVWLGRIDGRPARPGTYELRLRAVDEAGNRSSRTRPGNVRVRFIELQRDRIEVVARRRFSVRVHTDARSYQWRFAGDTGTSNAPVLVLRAPGTAGTYALFVRVGDHADRAEVVVSEAVAQP